MPRTARKKSRSGIYHIMLRGANKQEIFHDEEDSTRFLETIEKYKKQAEFKVHGWCLMGNHVHLLLGEGNEEISVTMKRIEVSYAWYYNLKYGTVGHLFQDRFHSEDVITDASLLRVIRYIHHNPLKAGLAKKPGEWKLSSCKAYYETSAYFGGLLDKELILDMFGKDFTKAVKAFTEFNEAKNDDSCMDCGTKNRLTDEAARIAMLKLVSIEELTQIKCFNKQKRDELLDRIFSIEGLTQRQVARILGISPNLVFKGNRA